MGLPKVFNAEQFLNELQAYTNLQKHQVRIDITVSNVLPSGLLENEHNMHVIYTNKRLTRTQSKFLTQLIKRYLSRESLYTLFIKLSKE